MCTCTLSSKPINPPVLSMNLALAVWLHTHLCFLTGHHGLLQCHHLHTPNALWLTIVLTTSYHTLLYSWRRYELLNLIKKLCQSNVIYIKTIFCHTVYILTRQRLSKLHFCHAVSTATVIPYIVVQGKFNACFTQLDNVHLLLTNFCFSLSK